MMPHLPLLSDPDGDDFFLSIISQPTEGDGNATIITSELYTDSQILYSQIRI